MQDYSSKNYGVEHSILRAVEVEDLANYRIYISRI